MNQSERVLEYMKSHPLGITQREAVEMLGIYRLGARIWDLLDDGVNIRSEWLIVRNRFGERTRIKRYYLADAGEEREQCNE